MFVSEQERTTALGTFKDASDKAYYAKMIKLFKPMNKPQSGDWLQHHKQVHQAYANYKLPYYNQVTHERRTIYLMLFGGFNKIFIDKLMTFCGTFYPKLLVKTIGPLDFDKQLGHVKRRNHTYGKQYLAQDILAYMEKNVPKDAYCVMGITLNDIYPGENWNFVYGWAKYKARVGIFSFLRWDQEFAEGNTKEIDWDLILYPSMRTMVHEIGHMFAITHCVYYRCLMNGFNNIQQNYLNPMEFCPICFRKIITNIGFNIKQRYKSLIDCLTILKVKQAQKDIKFYEQLLSLSINETKPPTNEINKPKIPTNTQNRPNILNNAASNKNRGKSMNTGIGRRF